MGPYQVDNDVPALWDMLVHGNATVYGLETNHLQGGEEGSLVVYNSKTPFDTLRTQPVRPLVLRDGTLIAESEQTTTIHHDRETQTVSFERGE